MFRVLRGGKRFCKSVFRRGKNQPKPPQSRLSTSVSTIFLRDQWGPAAFDRRRNWHAAVTSTALRNLNARIGFSGSFAPPLTILTGHDDNGDLVFNDRPAGIGRNSARAVTVYNSSANPGYSFTLARRR